MNRWDVARIALYMFGAIALIAMLETLMAVTACTWLIVIQQRPEVGCNNFASNVRELITELLAGLLALIAAYRSPKD